MSSATVRRTPTGDTCCVVLEGRCVEYQPEAEGQQRNPQGARVQVVRFAAPSVGRRRGAVRPGSGRSATIGPAYGGSPPPVVGSSRRSRPPTPAEHGTAQSARGAIARPSAPASWCRSCVGVARDPVCAGRHRTRPCGSSLVTPRKPRSGSGEAPRNTGSEPVVDERRHAGGPEGGDGEQHQARAGPPAPPRAGGRRVWRTRSTEPAGTYCSADDADDRQDQQRGDQGRVPPPREEPAETAWRWRTSWR